MNQNLSPLELVNECKKYNIEIKILADSLIRLNKSFEINNNSQGWEAESTIRNILTYIPFYKSQSSIWGTTSDGVGYLQALRLGNMQINKSGVKKTFIKELKKLITE